MACAALGLVMEWERQPISWLHSLLELNHFCAPDRVVRYTPFKISCPPTF